MTRSSWRQKKTPMSNTSVSRWAGHRRGSPGSCFGPTGMSVNITGRTEIIWIKGTTQNNKMLHWTPPHIRFTMPVWRTMPISTDLWKDCSRQNQLVHHHYNRHFSIPWFSLSSLCFVAPFCYFNFTTKPYEGQCATEKTASPVTWSPWSSYRACRKYYVNHFTPPHHENPVFFTPG